MTRQVDRKLQHVRVAEYQYRHEAELAAGFLEDAGIPYYLQMDDAGGANLGLATLRPAALWVRAVDVSVARDLVALEEVDDGDQDEPEPTAALARLPAAAEERLTPQERVVSGGVAVALFSALPYLPYGSAREASAVALLAAGLAFVVASLVGRAPGPVERVVRMLSGEPPR